MRACFALVCSLILVVTLLGSAAPDGITGAPPSGGDRTAGLLPDALGCEGPARASCEIPVTAAGDAPAVAPSLRSVPSAIGRSATAGQIFRPHPPPPRSLS